jgi:AraC-like DNA-binding protein
MLTETVFRSDEVPAAERFGLWRDCLSRTHAPLDLTSDHADDFRAHQRRVELGELALWPATFQPLVFRRTPKLIRQSDPEQYHLSLLVRGTAGISWGSSELTFDAYDIHANDTSRPYEIRTGDSRLTIVGLEIPKRLLPLPRERADQAIGLAMSGREGPGALLAGALTQLTADSRPYRASDGHRMADILIDMAAALFAHVLDAESALEPESARRALLVRVKDFIRRNLHDPGLTPPAIAAAHHISLSYLHRLFQDDGATVAASIRDQRLDRARRDLAEPALAALPIHAVAARWGFGRQADFSRAFRAAYGMPPRDYRHRAARRARQPEDGV